MSDLEDDLAWQIRVAKLPEPVRELKFAKEAMGRMWRMDFAWPDVKLAVEVDGGIWVQGRHNRGSGYEKDAAKSNAAVALGWRVLHVTKSMIEDGSALCLIEQALNGAAA